MLNTANPRLLSALTALTVSALPAAAITIAPNLPIGYPTLATAPGTLTFTTHYQHAESVEFLTVSFEGTIDEAWGAGLLVWDTIRFNLPMQRLNQLEFNWNNPVGGPFYFEIGGKDYLQYPHYFPYPDQLPYRLQEAIRLDLPVVSNGNPPNGSFEFTYEYDMPFDGFGPAKRMDPAVALQFGWLGPIPMQEAYIYGPCPEDVSYSCGVGEFHKEMIDFDPDNPLWLWDRLSVIGGSIDTVVTFATVNGSEEPALVPLPAAGWLLGAALLGLGIGRRRR